MSDPMLLLTTACPLNNAGAAMSGSTCESLAGYSTAQFLNTADIALSACLLQAQQYHVHAILNTRQNPDTIFPFLT